MINNDLRPALPAEAVNAVRSGVVFVSVLGIVLGVMMMAWPAVTVFVAGLLLGISLITVGLFRLFFAFSTTGLGTGMRVLMLVLGVLMVVCGAIAVISPGEAWWMLATFIGIGWIFNGIQDLVGSGTGLTLAPRWLGIVGGLISVFAGIVLLVMSPIDTLPTLMWVLGLMLVITSIVTLVALPKKVPTA
ncbi:MAG: DUF308 domain-containing protein [Gordonia sp. (in: high G+C Gram-positive bacteria)]|uniref:HdeD family acid-resistance protein n=1 Tax=Gordonia sp. (in: high G+C Gram-positive bacteria) TaxID=84139 RepID=UPI0039E4FCAD